MQDNAFELEVVCSSVRSAVAAVRGGATRVELCSALSTAGVTPSSGLLRAVKRSIDAPVVVMIRPREGDFCYDETELDVMRTEIDACAEAGADGFVLGLLRADGTVDVERTAKLVRRCGSRPVIFHRAIDFAPDAFDALDAIVDAGCARVLTSGGAATGDAGVERAVRMSEHGAGRLRVILGGGLRVETFGGALRRQLRDYHVSGRAPVASPLASTLFDMTWHETDAELVRAMKTMAEDFFASGG